ncbi:apoptosis-associated speck-like protein containing a CARD isoform 1-T2 [Anomaloglossus baeobatrachus]|uniref:apoptosis-associated speck-like protein containing a CARD n=1 Tax=Anomaloglossus baeobatrachus TaxID=238106 RepID=UPI003F505995
MGKTVRDVLLQALENLEKKSFKKFKNKLNDWNIEEGYNKIPRGKLEDADPEDVADLIRRYYKDSYGIKVTLAVLEAINENQESEKLQKALQAVTDRTTTGADQGATSRAPIQERFRGATPGDQEHFVDRHRTQLIQWASDMTPLLDDLLQKKLILREQYVRVLSKMTSSDRMQELYEYVRSFGNEDKDTFLQSLKRHNGMLIKHLEEEERMRAEHQLRGSVLHRSFFHI